LRANFIASFIGALMYFATLTEVPIVQGLLGAGMGEGPALALLLAGPSLSLPSILVIAGELGWTKTLVYVGLVISLSTIAGFAFGVFV
ncbi:MAG TPA: permease, partial [Spirochaetia bacterium]|nr:permease [Spirochaetia bacterium]